MKQDDLWELSGRLRPTTIKREVFYRNHKHKHCSTLLKRSEKNPFYMGWYCAQHGSLLCWVNHSQAEQLVTAGVEDQRTAYVPEKYWKFAVER